jgi:hypothetical protein
VTSRSPAERELKASERRVERPDADLAAYRSLLTLRPRDALLRVPIMGRLLETGVRRCAHALDRLRAIAP